MSLKGEHFDIETHPEMWSKEIVAAVENLKKGKRNAEKKLYKFVSREITYKYYEELIERHKKTKKKKELYLSGHPIKEYLPVLFFFSIIGAISIIMYAIKTPNILVGSAACYLLITFFIYHYDKTDTIENKNREIAELKHQIYTLKDSIKGEKFIIELLEKELEKARNNSQE